MAKVGRNLVTTGLSGKLGDLIVFRVRDGKTYVSRAPQEYEQTETQKQQQFRFQEAVIYAKSALADENLRQEYEAKAQSKKGISPYNVAVGDFLKAPQIDEVDLSNYTGQPGSIIRILAVDDFKVQEVTVSILNSDGTEVESGPATQADGSIWWNYTATAANEALDGDKIIIRVTDQAGNLTEKESTPE